MRLRKNNEAFKTIRTIYSVTLDSLLIKAHLVQAKKELNIISELTLNYRISIFTMLILTSLTVYVC